MVLQLIRSTLIDTIAYWIWLTPLSLQKNNQTRVRWKIVHKLKLICLLYVKLLQNSSCSKWQFFLLTSWRLLKLNNSRLLVRSLIISLVWFFRDIINHQTLISLLYNLRTKWRDDGTTCDLSRIIYTHCP